MIELPEAITLGNQLADILIGKTVERVLPPNKPHKFCWFHGAPEDYEQRLKGRAAVSARGFGLYAEIAFEGGLLLCVNDGVNLRYLAAADAPKAYQLMLLFTDGTALACTVGMYGGILLHDEAFDDPYYLKSKNALSPFSKDFESHFVQLLGQSKQSLSMKAFLATDQRFPGLGNGVLQDILLTARLHPKRKLATLSAADKRALLRSVVTVLDEMTALGGRDTEKDLLGHAGGYPTKLCRNTQSAGCPICGGAIGKETYLGGSVYFCPACQPLTP